MNFTKIAALFLSAVLCASLCGCSSNEEKNGNSDNSASPNGSSGVSESTSTSGSSSDVPVSGTATFLIGADGGTVTIDEINEVFDNENNKISPDQLTKENFSRVTTSCAYYAKPLYSCLTDRESEYDDAELLFKDAPQGSQSDFVKVKKDDKIFGMTVAEAASEFNLNSSIPGVIVGTGLTLDGEITLDGYVRVVPDNEYGVSVGDILFIPTGKADLPVVRFDGCDKDGVITRRTGDVYIVDGKDGSITYTNEYSDSFNLGNINDTAADISAIPTDGSLVKVSVTVSNIRMTTTIEWMTFVSADIVNVMVK